EYVIMGQVLQAGAGQAPARQAAIGAGIPIEVGADTVNKVCASSIRAVEIADQMIRAGDHELIVTGGMESMSNAPYLLKKARFGYRLGNGELVDSMVFDGLTSTFDKLHMVQQASKVARELGVSREDQDGWALRSHERAVRAIDDGRFEDEIVPVGDFAVDEGPRRDTSLEQLAALKPVFDPEGTTTAGNAPGVNDGAGCVIVASEELARRRNLPILATILSQAYVADEFAYLARTPAKAGKLALEKAGKTIDDVERVELNEAFASVALGLCTAPAAFAAGPDPGVTVGGQGVAAPGGKIRYVAVGGRRATTTLVVIRARDGSIVRSATYGGAYGVPAVTFDGARGGVSSDGSTLVLADIRTGNGEYPLKRHSSFAVVDAKSLRLRARVELPGHYTFDAL